MLVHFAVVARLLLISMLLCTYLGELRAQPDDPALRSRFVDGVMQASQKLQHLSLRAKCTFSSRNITISDTVQASFAKSKRDPYGVSTSEFTCAVRGPYSLMRRTNKAGIERLMVRNGTYAFSISRTSGDMPPTLQFLEQLGSDPSTDSKIADTEKEAKGLVLAAYNLWGTPLAELVQDCNFRIGRVYSVESDGIELVRVDFEYEVKQPQNQIDFDISNGFAVFDPTRNWVVTEYGGTYHNHINQSAAKHKWTFVFDDPVGEVPLAKTVTNSLDLLSDPGSTMQTVISTEIISRDEVPEAEFYLSYYGRPEPNFQRRWFGVWVWYLIGAIGSLGAVWVILRRRRVAS